MYNLVVLAARPPEWTHEQFIAWWRGDHAELTCRLPGLRAWRHTEIEAPSAEPIEQAKPIAVQGWDGLSVLSFDSADDLRKALDSPEWAAAVAQVGDMRGRRIAVMGSEREMFGAPGHA